MKSIIIALVIGIIVLIFRNILGSPAPVESDYYDAVLDTSADPLQTATETEPFYVRVKHGTMKLTPKAAYSATARVAHKKKYLFGWNAALATYDLALSWGKLNHDNVMPHIRYRQSGRWYFFRFDALCPVSGTYISTHSSNNHIIHASENLLRVLKKVHVGDFLRLDGYLVFADGFIRGDEVHWYSSLNRKDSGDGACEVFYVNRIWHDGKIYE